MRIIVAGSSGQLGTEIISGFKKGISEIGEISKKYRKSEIIGINSRDIDISNLDKVLQYIEHAKPNIIINTAAYTNVDGCEENSDMAFKVNSLGARNLAVAAEKVGAKLIHISTDYVFDGSSNIPYKEYDITKPVSVYGKSKLLGEKYVQDFCSKYFIVRTAWLYGDEGKNFVKTILKAAREKGYLEVVNDQRGNPTNVEDLAYHILKIALTDEYGIYHCTGNGECSWYEFACKIVEYAEIDCVVKPITSDKLDRKARRPSYSCLDNMMLRCTVGDETRNWNEALKSFIKRNI
ncbi:dTDP-4-dehydrorhamnose reductase [Clostridium sp. A1-XYC3]|uniref:dTDP-4-dehydrorhamnose reductase n=1 Tax=Clostridium tanneri TaxID=3037988 RepID=A0ABU4JNI0_9CLOT|nr:dTDP-4-dehydrorhamnose reductase [Clostridium sp. A1-XYC3]MDW8799684.1 dTDP-4-dehydrorhamnose reductase [Clostridium sp. A1-XYC3]